MPRTSSSACRYFPGLSTSGPRKPSGCTHCWICAAIFPFYPYLRWQTKRSQRLGRPLPGSRRFYVMDRGYLDFARLYRLNMASAFFVIRAKKNMLCHRLYSHPVDRSTNLRCDQTVRLTGFYSATKYPDKLRRVKLIDPDTGKTMVFLTNNFHLPAQTITELYRCR